jgi:hypothetical protein
LEVSLKVGQPETLIEDDIDSRERFWDQWKGRELDDIPCVPCRSDDLYEAYRAWVKRDGIGKAVALHSLIAFIRKQDGVMVKQARYRGVAGAEKRMVVMPLDSEPSKNVNRSKWLGACVDEFRVALDGFRRVK